VVFVTAFDQYAVEAFEQGAVDYVLKPFNEERLAITVDRLKGRLGSQPLPIDELVATLAARLAPKANENHLRWIKASVGSNVRLIPVEEVLFFQSDDKYTRVVTHEADIARYAGRVLSFRDGHLTRDEAVRDRLVARDLLATLPQGEQADEEDVEAEAAST
jgi:DNA-binding LytR/AlgR family response regulator